MRNITSNPTRRRNQGKASPSSPARRIASIHRIVPKITGIISGNNTNGSKSSRALAFRVTADNSVPKTQKPTVPNKVTRNKLGITSQDPKIEENPKQRNDDDLH